MMHRARGPSTLALILIAALATSCAATNSGGVDATPTFRTSVDAHVGKNFTGDSTRVGDLSRDFTANETVFVVVDVPGKIEGTIRGRWVFGAETVHEQTLAILEGVNAYRFRLEPPAGGHRVGRYTFEVYINDNQAETESFEVRAG